ncbi:MAG: leucine--tRNA ligase [Leptospira sp.]|nr:leucine--tRNA ligase [Leptospira sp.]
MEYPFEDIEKKWQNYWEEKKTFCTDLNSNKPKYYCLDMFPYPSGAGLHVGHPEGYTATDIITRYKRMKGFEVLHPMGWDAFGLPAERYAMTTGIHPKKTTEENINNFRRQIKMLGLSYDWSREISTTNPDYYKFTQWIFLKLFHSYYNFSKDKAEPISVLVQEFESNGSSALHSDQLSQKFSAKDWNSMSEPEQEAILSQFRLVYLAFIPVNWCEGLGTVLANEEVEEWVSKGYSVIRKPMRQYMMRITAYAERLLKDLELVSWPASTLEMQKNWIGKSQGLEIGFQLESGGEIRVFTTRPDTLFGATYLVLAPEHPILEKITATGQKEQILEYQKASAIKSDLDRTELAKDKSGIFTGAYAINPVTNEKIPVWISDYVLFSYGTGAIMAVPAHDSRDYEFAKKFNLEIRPVIAGGDVSKESFDSKDSTCINSSGKELKLDGLDYKAAFKLVSDWVQKKKIGKVKIQFKLRDWLFARQRYWGEPIPLVHFENGITKSLSEDELPLVLPELNEFKPSGTGESPLALSGSWLEYKDPATGRTGRRETNTMPQWAGSCWYYLRFIDPENQNALCDSTLEKKWMPVDLYVGGSEHAVLHLLYSRFWHKALFDLGYVSTPEPFKKLVHQGLILGEDKKKMSKSLGNVVNPDEVVKEYGADSLRLFEMFMGPFEMVKPWSTKGVEGISRFLNRVWRLFHGKEGDSFLISDLEPNEAELRILHRTIKKVSDDIENFSFNTAISQMMIFVNEITPSDRRPRKILEPFIKLLSPFAPHLTEELWEKMGNKKSIAYFDFPESDPRYLISDKIKIMIQVNGKLRGEFEASKEIEQAEAISLSKTHEKVIPFIKDKTIKKEIYVKEKLVNLVTD